MMAMQQDVQMANDAGSNSSGMLLTDSYGQYRADASGSLDPLPDISNEATYSWKDLFKFSNRWYYHPVQTSPKGLKTVPITSDQKCKSSQMMRIVWTDIEHPLFCPFGLQDGKDPKPDSFRKTLDVCVEDPELLAALNRFDERNIDMAAKFSEAWFGKKLSREFLEVSYKKMAERKVNSSDLKKSEQYKPLMRFKVTVDGGQGAPVDVYVQTGYDSNGDMTVRKGTSADLTKCCNIIPISDFKGLWISSLSFGTVQTLHSVLVVFPPKRQHVTPISFFGHMVVEQPNAGGNFGSGSNMNTNRFIAPANNNVGEAMDTDDADSVYDDSAPVEDQMNTEPL